MELAWFVFCYSVAIDDKFKYSYQSLLWLLGMCIGPTGFWCVDKWLCPIGQLLLVVSINAYFQHSFCSGFSVICWASGFKPFMTWPFYWRKCKRCNAGSDTLSLAAVMEVSECSLWTNVRGILFYGYLIECKYEHIRHYGFHILPKRLLVV